MLLFQLGCAERSAPIRDRARHRTSGNRPRCRGTIMQDMAGESNHARG